MKSLFVLGVLAACGLSSATISNPLSSAAISETAAAPATVYDFTMKSIDGKDVKLSQYKGKKLLIVNTASKCGYTPQYKELRSCRRSMPAK